VSPEYRLRPATFDDADVLVRHRVGMFTDMGLTMDVARLEATFRAWLAALMPPGTYRAWLVETTDGQIVGGGGITILPWPPGPSYAGDRLAFVYNVYVDAAHRRRGLARQIMDAIHTFCRDAGITAVALNASRDGLPLYQSMGYVESPTPMMFLALPAHP
jgi:GNAT superfamily N-acetyltransferase